MKKPLFQRRKPSINKPDSRGKVVITLVLREGALPVKGNLSRSVTIHNAKVSEVHAAILKHLLGEISCSVLGRF